MTLQETTTATTTNTDTIHATKETKQDSPPPKEEELGESQNQSKESSTAKRSLQDMQNENECPTSAKKTKVAKKEEEVLDICEKLQIQPGTRMQVRWTIHNKDNNNNNDATTPSKDETPPSPPKEEEESLSIWWGATLQPFDSHRTHTLSSSYDDDAITLPIRTLLYDAQTQHGFPQTSVEDVVFLTPVTLMSLREGGEDLSEEQPWRLFTEKEEEEEITIPGTEEATRNMLNVILSSSFSKFNARMETLPASVKADIADKMAQSKERMLRGLMSHLEECKGDGAKEVVITPEFVQNFVKEMQKEDSQSL